MKNKVKDFENKKINEELLNISDEDRYLYKSDEPVNYNNFTLNNWIANSNNAFLKEIAKAGGALWVSLEGVFCFRHQTGEQIVEIDQVNKLERLLSIYLNKNSTRLFKFTNDIAPDIAYTDLRIVKDDFTPFATSEFYYKNKVWCRTSFKPSKYLSRDYNHEKLEKKYPKNILSLISNLVNYKPEREKWVINWLAGFFKTLKRSRVSLVLRGDQGSGKSLFFNEVISKLFGEEYSIVVSDENLESDFKSWVDEKLFYNLNEIAVDMKSRRNIKNFLKTLVTDEYVNVQSKFKDFKKVILYGNILITSNEAFPLEVEINDRRFTIFQTGKSLKTLDIDTNQLVKDINNELPLFAEYLRNYEVDWKLYHTALDTPEKQAIVDGTTSSMRRFIHAVITHEIGFFEDLNNPKEMEELSIYNAMLDAFNSREIDKGLLYRAYTKIYDSTKTSKKFTLELRNLEPSVFGKDKLKRSINKFYYKI